MEHLSSTLMKNGIVAYMWDAGQDRYVWAGDLQGFLGLGEGEYPSSNAQLHQYLDPQNVPERLSALQDVMDRNPEYDVSSSFTGVYQVRRVNGTYAEVEETATLMKEGASGRRVLQGFFRMREGGATGAGVPPASDAVSANSFNSYGRMMLSRKIEEWFDLYRQERGGFGYLLTVGIDRIALFNDVMGPRLTDEIIERTGERLRQIVGDSGLVTRVEGDVYGLFFTQAPYNEMAAVAKYILNNFYNVPLQTSMGPVGIGISVGGVTMDRAKDSANIITMAEMAMHMAKEKGRSCFVSYDEAAHKAEDNKRLLKSADTFLRAMKNNRLRLAFQPIVDSRTNGVSFHECLMRLIDDDGKMISAGMFIPAIEQMGMSRIVDQHALRMAIRELDMFPDLQLSVNVSNLSLTNRDWLRHLVAALRDRPSVAKRLILEITESAVIADPDNTKRIVSTLKELGCRVALDDFGAGYTAFSQLRNLNVDLVKIDKSFIRNIGDEHNHLFVRTLKSLTEGVNIQTVGEGAETMAEAKMLASDGIDHIQGYVFGFPRVERLWLPKNHAYRQIVAGQAGTGEEAGAGDFLAPHGG